MLTVKKIYCKVIVQQVTHLSSLIKISIQNINLYNFLVEMRFPVSTLETLTTWPRFKVKAAIFYKSNPLLHN